MNANLGWMLAVLAVGVGWMQYGWPGVAMAVSVVVFWLLLQFSRAMRAMKAAGEAPVGHVPSAVMLNAKLQRGMPMLKVIGLTRSLGEKVGTPGNDNVGRWEDHGGSHVTLTFAGGKLQSWALQRPPDAVQPDAPQGEAASPAP